MSQVIMVATIGDKELHIGKCTHAQARILTKKEHGEIRDGKLHLRIRPIHLQIATGHGFKSPDDDPNVSRAELHRREEWLKGLLVNTLKAEEKVGVSTLKEIQEGVRQELGSPVSRTIRASEVPEVEMTEEEVQEFYQEYEDAELPDDLWDDTRYGEPLETTAAINKLWGLESHETGLDWTLKRQNLIWETDRKIAALIKKQFEEWEGDPDAIKTVTAEMHTKNPKLSDRWRFRKKGDGAIMIPVEGLSEAE